MKAVDRCRWPRSFIRNYGANLFQPVTGADSLGIGLKLGKRIKEDVEPLAHGWVCDGKHAQLLVG